MNPGDMMSPVRSKLPRADASGTPARAERSLHQPSPNRTEAAAAMMHLFSSSAESGPAGDKAISASKKPPGLAKAGKVKRRYVRKVPKKVNTSVKAEMKAAWSASPPAGAADAETKEPGSEKTGKIADKETKEAGESQEQSHSNGEGKTEGDDGRFFPFREYNRKEKSLGLLCENFLKLYRGDRISEICLDKAAAELGVERRRIYDIVNILESIFLVSRKSKNLYNWHGLQCLPSSIVAMKKRYEEALMSSPSGSGGVAEYAFKGKDRRRGKSLSKLSQMFVQLFLAKEHCIIPLDQAAKQLIQSEQAENEEDRQLKTKIRRLYDVANVLVSVGLIEKLQLSNCRKPVFRWKVRDANAAGAQSASANGESLEVKVEGAQDHSFLAGNSAHEAPGLALRGHDPDDTDALKTSQSCDSDMSEDDGSDSQSDSSNYGGTKRKQNDLDAPDSGSSEDEAVAKRAKSEQDTSARPPVASIPTPNVLRMDASNTPIHPRDMLLLKEEELRAFMQQYTKEYVDHLMAHQHTSPTAGPTPVGVCTPLMGTSAPLCAAAVAAAAITKDLHSTPVTLPSLASSIQELLLTESPQSVEMLPAAMRVDSKTLPAITTSPVAAAGEPEVDPSPKPLLLRKAQSRDAVAASAHAPKAVELDEDACYNSSRNLIRALQPPAPHS